MKLLEASETVRRERIKGATWSLSILAKAIIEDYEDEKITCDMIDRVTAIIRSSNRTMAPLWNLATLLEEGCRNGRGMDEVARNLLWYINDARQRMYHGSLPIQEKDAIITTISYSSAVELILSSMNPRIIYTLESTPGGEGVELAKHLRRRGVNVALVPDTMMASVVERSSIILMGADAVTLDPCLYNKIGSLTLAITAKYYNKPVVAVFESYKINPALNCGKLEVETRLYRVEGWGDILYNLFDAIDGSLVSAAFTEYGLMEFNGDKLNTIYNKFKDMVLGSNP